MTKADVVEQISAKTGIEKAVVLKTVESFMDTVKGNMTKGENVYLRGFGSFIIKKRAKKTGRNILNLLFKELTNNLYYFLNQI